MENLQIHTLDADADALSLICPALNGRRATLPDPPLCAPLDSQGEDGWQELSLKLRNKVGTTNNGGPPHPRFVVIITACGGRLCFEEPLLCSGCLLDEPEEFPAESFRECMVDKETKPFSTPLYLLY